MVRASLGAKLARRKNWYQRRLGDFVRRCATVLLWFPSRRERKILYVLTPPPRLRNIGDHAQVVAIRRWLNKHFATRPVLEVNKDDVASLIWFLRWLVTPLDLVLIHSGGNLGDRGIWSEAGRRQIIARLTATPVVSLPQTIYFSETPNGQKERERTCEIYRRHSRLMVVARDKVSERLAMEMFPNANILAVPDFVLSLPPRVARRPSDEVKVLFCLRHDSEAALSDLERDRLVASVDCTATRFDTTIEQNISANARETIVEETLTLFESHDAVVTDRFHGLIFAVLCRKPTVVLRTVDHKLTSALDWFSDVAFVRFAATTEEVSQALEDVLAIESRAVPDWDKLFFEPLADHVRSHERGSSLPGGGRP